MKEPVKLALLAGVLLVGLLFLGVLLVPVIFEDRIVERLRTELNEELDATVRFSKVEVSLLSTFPTLTAQVTEPAIVGKGVFEETTLFSADSVGAGLDLGALIFDRSIEIESITVERPVAHLVIDHEGRANYDILREDPDGAADPGEAKGTDEELSVEIKRYRVSGGTLTYVEPGVYVRVEGLAHDGRAKLAGSIQRIASETTIDALTARLDGMTYLKEAKTTISVDATLDSEEQQLVLRALELAINQLALDGSGQIGWADEGTDLDLEIASKKGLPIRALISAIPNAYAADFAGLKGSGAFSIAADVKGQLGPDHDDIPSFSATFDVHDGAFKYPDLPLGVSDLHLDVKMKHPGGNLDRMRLDVPKYSVAAGKSHARGRLTVVRPISRPELELVLDGQFDAEEMAKAYPIPDVETLAGLIVIAIDLASKGDRIEKLNGSIAVSNLRYQAPGSPSVHIRKARVDLSPENTKIQELQAQIGESDLSLTGLVSPLTTLWMGDQTVTASAWLRSKRLRVEDFVSAEEDEKAEMAAPFTFPENLDANLELDVGKLTYGDVVLENFKGTGRLRNRKLTFEDVRATALGGAMKLDGNVATPVNGQPTFDVTYEVDEARFSDAFEALPSMRAYVPIARYLDGRFSADLSASGTLDETLSPRLDSIDASGFAAALQSRLTSDFKPLAALNQAIPTIPKPLDIEGVRARFKVEDGTMKLSPTTVKARGIAMQVSGAHGLDQEMKYQVASEVPLDELSSKLAKEAKSLGLDLSKAKTVGVRASLTGTIEAPRVSVDLDTKALRGAVADAISTELEEQRARALREATVQARRLVDEARKRADQIRSEAAKAAEKLRKEGYARAAQVEREGTGNPLKAVAAREAAKRIRSETDKRTNQLVAEADKRAAQAVAEAQKRADQMMSEAAKRSEQGSSAAGKQTDKIR